MTDLFAQYQGVETHLVVLEIIGVFFGFLSVWYAKKGNIWVYPTGIISTVLFVYLLWHYVLWGRYAYQCVLYRNEYLRVGAMG